MKARLFIIFLSTIGILSACKTSYVVKETNENRISISEELPEDSTLVAMIKPYKETLDKKMNHVLAYNPHTLDKNGANFPLGIFITDLILKETNEKFQKLHPGEKIDAVLMNTGGLRRTFEPGNLTVRSIYELMPFENELVVVTLSSDQFVAMVNFLKESDKNHPIAGFSFHKNQEVLNILVDGKPFDQNKNYNVVTNDYLQKGGDNMDFLTKPIKAEYLHLKLRDLFIEGLEKVDTIQLNKTPRYILN
ncbi:MAG: 5'-nucleotidase C-terminal domain-containing protein [Weeksellaceae bacterium]